MKIGCITWWRNNYGSILQAYALQKVITDTVDAEYEILNQYSKNVASVENFFVKLKTIGWKHTIKRLVFRFSLPGLRNRVRNLQSFIDINLQISNTVFTEDNIETANLTYDTFICGSDQIWNPANVDINDRLYWMEFVKRPNKKIAYAPSIGVKELDSESNAKIKDHLESFDAISCREESGTKYINSVLGYDVCQTVLDPTLLLSSTEWNEVASAKCIDKEYIFAYLLRGTVADRKLVKKLSKASGLPVVTIPFLDSENPVMYDLKFGDIKMWDASPSDFLSLIKHSKFVVTDSFHCMIFSIHFHKTFYTLKKLGNHQMERIYGLQKLLHTGDRMINPTIDPSSILEMNTIDWDDVDQQKKKYKEQSVLYLKNALMS